MAPLPFHQPGMYRLLFLLAKRARFCQRGGFFSSLQRRGERRAQRAVWDERSEQCGASAASSAAVRASAVGCSPGEASAASELPELHEGSGGRG